MSGYSDSGDTLQLPPNFPPRVSDAAHFASPDPGPVPAVDGDADFTNVMESARLLIRPISSLQEALPENDRTLHLASHPRMNVLVRFLNKGVRLLPWNPAESWQLELVLDTDLNPTGVRQDATRVEYVYPGIVEWYRNRAEGLEHGFVLTQADPVLQGTRTIPVRLSGMRAEPLERDEASSSDLQFVNEDGIPLLAYSDLKVWDAAGRSLHSHMYPTSQGFAIDVQTDGASYPITVDPLITRLQQQLGPTVSGFASYGDQFGASLDAQQDQIFVGSPGEGHVYVFTNIDGTWALDQLLKQEAFGFGNSIQAVGDWLAIGANTARNPGFKTGEVYLYRSSGTSWTFHSKLTAPDGASGDEFGYALALEDDWLAVGSPYDDDQGDASGSVSIFHLNGTEWSFRQKLNQIDGREGDRFGHHVVMNRGRLFISAPYRDGEEVDQGVVRTYTLDNGEFHPGADLTSSSLSQKATFGFTMALDGQDLLVGAPGLNAGNGNTGGVFAFRDAMNSWQEIQTLFPPPQGTWTKFGQTMDVNDGIACVGRSSSLMEVYSIANESWAHDQTVNGIETNLEYRTIHLTDDFLLSGKPASYQAAPAAGVVEIFRREETGWMYAGDIFSGNASSGSEFGIALDQTDTHAVCGAPGDADNGLKSGAVYLFQKRGALWYHQQKLVLPEPVPQRALGTSVALSNDSLIVGAPFNTVLHPGGYIYRFQNGAWTLEAELAQGLNNGLGMSVDLDGDRAVLGAPGTWYNYTTRDTSVFVYVRSGTTWILETEITPADAESGNLFGWSVNLSGDMLMVGAPMDNAFVYGSAMPNAGSVYVYAWSEGSWTPTQEIHHQVPKTDAGFGCSIARSEDILVVGSIDRSRSSSSIPGASFYGLGGNQWTYSSSFFTDGVGYAVGISNSLAVLGSNRVRSPVYILQVDTASNQLTVLERLENPDNAYATFGESVSIHGLEVLIAVPDADGLDPVGTEVRLQGTVLHYHIASVSTDADKDGFDDDWETANGFDPTVTGDVGTRDRDEDGSLDVAEIFAGTDLDTPGPRAGLQNPQANTTAKTLKARYRRSTASIGLNASYRWSTDLANWHHPGAGASGVKVDFTESVVDSGDGYEIVEVTATLSLGDAHLLFISLDLNP